MGPTMADRSTTTTSCKSRRTVPNDLWRLAEEWRNKGRPPQRGIHWSSTFWRRWLPEYDHLYDSLPEPLSRSVVQRYVDERAEADPAAAFVTTMMWGFANVGYGPYRTRHILESGPDVPVRLASAIGATSAEHAYAALAGPRRVSGLGPAFGTKWIHFASGGEAPILDRLVTRWLERHRVLRLNPVPWSRATYSRYLTLLQGWSGTVGLHPVILERLMFEDEAKAIGSQWG